MIVEDEKRHEARHVLGWPAIVESWWCDGDAGAKNDRSLREQEPCLHCFFVSKRSRTSKASREHEAYDVISADEKNKQMSHLPDFFFFFL